MENQGSNVHENGVPVGKEVSKTAVIIPFSCLITLSKRSTEAMTFDILVL